MKEGEAPTRRAPKTAVGFRWSDEVRVAFAVAASDARRQKSTMCELIVEEWLRSRGYLPAATRGVPLDGADPAPATPL